MKHNFKILLIVIVLTSLACKQATKPETSSKPEISTHTNVKPINNEEVKHDSIKATPISKPTQSTSLEIEKEASDVIDIQQVGKDIAIKYQLNQFDKSLILSSKLLEISALSYDPITDRLLAVNDEIARVYYLDKLSGDIVDQWNFGRAGDYEGVELVDNIIYAIKSNGQLYKIENKGKPIGLKTNLSYSNDVEGLGYHKDSHSLLIACKGNPDIKGQGHTKNVKNIFAFDLKTQKLDTTPFLSLYEEELVRHFRSVWMKNKRLTEKGSKAFMRRIKSFAPSAIAVNAVTGDIFILSSVGKSLIICNQSKQIKEIHFLDENIHKQPEGLTFDNQNSLYISNEGKGLVAKIFKFDPI